MDPLTIATAAASLVTSASTVSAWLFNLIGEVRNVDAKIFDLAKELKLQETLLLLIEKTVRECQSQALTLAHIDDNMWNQIWKTVMDCKATLDKLDVLIKLISPENNDPGARTSSEMLKKPGMLIQFKFYKKDMSAFSDKVYKSNTAIQMALSVIYVSLTFRTNASQEDIFQELQILRELVEKALEPSDTNTQETLDRTTALQDRNLQGLAQSAKRFHTAASTAASMRHGLEERHSTWGGSEQGDLSDGTREHIERRNQLAIIEESQKEITIDMSFAGTSKDSIPISPLSSQLANTTPKALKDSSRHIQTVHGHIGTVRSVVFSPSGRILASGSDDATIKTWEVVKGGHLQQLQEIDDLGGMVSHLVFSPDGESLSAIIGGSEFRIWTLDSKNRLQQTKKQSWGTSRFLAIAFSPRSLLYTGLRDGRILEWHVDSTSNTPTKSGLDSPSGSGVIFISFDTDYKSQYLISGSEDGSIWIFKRPYSSYQADDTWSWTFSGRPVMALTSIAMLPDKRHLVIGSADRMLRCWTFRRYALLASLGRFKDGAQQKLCGDEEVCCVAASQGYQTTWIASGSEDHTVQLFNYNPSSETGFKKVDTLKGHSDTVCSVAFSPNGRRLISASADHTIRVWKLDE